MSLFIHAQNQSLLWNIISNMDITKAIFVEGSPQKSIWFKNIIEEFYIKYYGRNISIDELRELNRQVIAYMVENLKTIYKSKAKPQSVQMQSQVEPQTIYSRNAPKEYNEQFGKRQKEYETMVKKVPPEVNFSENIKDEPILNMEELIRQQQQMREYEFNSLQGPGPVAPVTNNNITIHKEENVSVQQDIEEIKTKKVSWSDESTIQQDLELIKSQIADLYNIVQQLQKQSNGNVEKNDLN
jgi:hypothetical protein